MFCAFFPAGSLYGRLSKMCLVVYDSLGYFSMWGGLTSTSAQWLYAILSCDCHVGAHCLAAVTIVFMAICSSH